MTPRARFTRIAALDDAEIPLGEAALCIAAEARPDLDAAYYLRELEQIAERARPSLSEATSTSQSVERLNEALFGVERFRGNEDEYHDPRNSFLDEVLDRRTGIPITLSVVYIEVARRLGLDAVGVGFPGHFLAKVCCPEGDVLVDPFMGSMIDRSACEVRLRQMYGDDARLDPRMLAPATHREILCRMLRNLKQIYLGAQSWDETLACCERLLLLLPDDPAELRDRGLVLRQLECFRAAAVDLERFLSLAPQDPTRGAIERVLADLEPRLRQIH